MFGIAKLIYPYQKFTFAFYIHYIYAYFIVRFHHSNHPCFNCRDIAFSTNFSGVFCIT